MKAERVLVIGAVNVDHYFQVSALDPFRSLSWWPQNSEGALTGSQRYALDHILTASPEISARRSIGGGQAGNFAVTLARCGVDVVLFASVGNDELAAIALEDLGDVDLSHVARVSNTAEAFIFVDVHGARDILLFAPDEQVPSAIDSAVKMDVAHAHFTSLPTETQLEAQRRISDNLPASTSQSLDIGALYAQMGHENLKGFLRTIRIVFGTESELTMFAGAPFPLAANILLDDGLHSVCCKRGALGASIISKGGIALDCRAPSVAAIDSTGAGDVLAAVFVAATLGGASETSALQIAVQLASKSVTDWGRGAYPTHKEFAEAIERMSHLE